MLYLLLQRDLQKISLACVHVLSDFELSDALNTIELTTRAALNRVWDLKCEKATVSPVIPT